jgi:beta-phosphoglucomutase-like phosphatase (HAD superfamily)
MIATKNLCVFDLDGVISKTQKLHAAAWIKTINTFLFSESIPLKFSENDYIDKFDGRSRTEAISDFLSDLGYVNCNTHHDLISYNKNEEFKSLLLAASKSDLIYEDTITLMDYLFAKNYVLALASSSKNARQVLDRFDLCKYFDIVVDGEDIEKLSLIGKPAPDIFDLCIDRCGGFENLNVTIFEDSISGVSGALHSRARQVVWIQRHEFFGDNMEKLAIQNGKILMKVNDLNELKIKEFIQ